MSFQTRSKRKQFARAARQNLLRLGNGFENVPFETGKLGVLLGNVRPPFIRQANGHAVLGSHSFGHGLSVFGGSQLFFKIHNLFDLHQKPTVNFREAENLLDGEARAQGVAKEEDAFVPRWRDQLAPKAFGGAREDVAVAIDFRADAPGFAVAAQAAAANLQRAQAFLQAFLERAPDGHRFADTFHLRGERGVGLREFLEGNARNLGDDVINARLEARGGFARDVVLEFVEQVADGEFGEIKFRNRRRGLTGLTSPP